MPPAVRRRAVLAGCGFAVAAVTALAPAAQAADCTMFASPSGSDSAAGTQASPLADGWHPDGAQPPKDNKQLADSLMGYAGDRDAADHAVMCRWRAR
jgi:hypothetical protein